MDVVVAYKMIDQEFDREIQRRSVEEELDRRKDRRGLQFKH